MGRTFTYDQDKVKELRMKLIEAALDVVNDEKKIKKWSKYKKEMILKMSGNLIPRVNEVSGLGGGTIKISFDSSFDAVTSKTTGSSPEQSEV